MKLCRNVFGFLPRKRRSRDSCDLLRLSCSDSSYTNLPMACSACNQDKWFEFSWIGSQSSNLRWRRVIRCFILQFCARCLDFFEGGHSVRTPASAAQHLSPIFLCVKSYWPWQELKDKGYLFTPLSIFQFLPDANVVFGLYSSQWGLVVTLGFKISLRINKLFSHLSQTCQMLLSDVGKADLPGLTGGTPLASARMVMMMMLFEHRRGQVKTFLHLWLVSLVVSLVRAEKNVLVLAKILQNEECSEERLADPAWCY